MRKQVSTFLTFLIILLPLACVAQNTFDITTVTAWQELPSSPAMWKANTNYKVTSNTIINKDGNLPNNSQICIISNGSLTINNANILCGNNTAFYVAGGNFSMNNSSMETGKNSIFYEGELGNVILNNSSILLGTSSILTINGRYLQGTNSTLEGTSSTLVAPIKRVFGQGIEVTGKWIVDQAYPQWFKDDNDSNWATAINKAIKMKGTGVVFLPRGKYTISSSIFVPFGIQLRGEPGRNNSGPNTDCTNIVPSIKNNSFNGGYMVLVNIKHKDNQGHEITVNNKTAEWEVNYPNAGTQLENITFTCSRNNSYKCILCAGGVTLNKLTWNNCLQAVASANNTYNDQRIITNCSFYQYENHPNIKNREHLYAFDLNSLGDALIFTGNAVHNTDNYTKALRLFYCDGGNITSNILNDDILIEQCKAITFNSNHCENGVTVTIQSSTVVNNSNFYEKGTTPNIIITNSTDQQNSSVTINGDQFVYYDGLKHLIDGNESPDQAASRLLGTNDFDIAIDGKSQLSLNKVYRYVILTNTGIGTQNLFGINLATIGKNGTLTPNKSFNRLSHKLSSQSIIKKSNKVDLSSNRLSPGNSRIYVYGKGTATWLGESGNYSYSFEILDDDGNITNKSSLLQSVKENQSVLQLEKGKDGVMICLADTGEARNNVYVRLKRHGTDGTKTVEFPVAGSEHIYDNGISVSGYKWK